MKKTEKNHQSYLTWAGALVRHGRFAGGRQSPAALIVWDKLPKLLSLRATAGILQVHPNTLRQWDDGGRLRAVRLGQRRDRRYDRQVVKQLWIERGLNQVVYQPSHRHFNVGTRTVIAGTASLIIAIIFQFGGLAWANQPPERSVVLRPRVCEGWLQSDRAKQIDLTAIAPRSDFSPANSAVYDANGRFTEVVKDDIRIMTGTLDAPVENINCRDFRAAPSASDQLVNFRLRLSMSVVAMKNSTDSFLVQIRTSTDKWQTVGSVPANNDRHQYEFLWPGGELSDPGTVEIQVIPDTNPGEITTMAYLDGIELRANVEPTAEPEAKPESTRQLDRLAAFSQTAYRTGDQPIMAVPKERTKKFLGFVVNRETWTLKEVEVIGPLGQKSKAEYTVTDARDGNLDLSNIHLNSAKLRPGKNTVRVRMLTPDGGVSTIEKSFLWGVVAINVTRAIARPGELQTIGMGILDDKGRTICDAELTLIVTDPRGKKIKYSTQKKTIELSGECVDKGVTNKADYTMTFRPDIAGTYHLDLKATTSAGLRTAAANFQVDPSLVFDVERVEYPTRIYPPAEYPVRIAVTPLRDYQGMVYESVPTDFKISNILPPADPRPSIDDPARQTIAWAVDWTAGETYFLTYTFDAPDISPALFLTGPLTIGGSFLEPPIFAEPRQWQIASDEVGAQFSGRSYTMGFELNSTTAGMEYTTNINTPTISATTKHSGSYAMRANPTTSTQGATYTFYNSDEISYQWFARAYIYVASAPTAQTEILVFRTSADTNEASIRLNTDRTLELWDETGTPAQVGSDSSAVPLNTWTRVELAYSVSYAMTVARIDGVEFAADRGGRSFSTGVSKLAFGVVTTNASADIYFDDIAINNDGASGGTDIWPGEGSIVYLRPNGNGSLTGWNGDYTAVDDPTEPNDATDYVNCTANNQTESYTLQDSSAVGIGTADLIKLTAFSIRYGGGSDALTRNLIGRLYLSGNDTSTRTIASTSWTTNQATTGAAKNQVPTSYDLPGSTSLSKWTAADLDSAYVYITASDCSPQQYVTAIWVAVEYQPASGGRIFSSGFELQDTTAGMEWTAKDGSPTISTTTHRGGDAALRVSSLQSVTRQALNYNYTGYGLGSFFVRTYLYIATGPSAENRIIDMRDSSATVSNAYITMDADRKLQLYDENGAIGSLSSALTTSAWYRIELHFDNNDSSVSHNIEAKINGTVFATGTEADSGTDTYTLGVGGNLNSEAQTTGEWFFDDVAINTNYGTTQNGYPGPGKITHLRPNAAGDMTDSWGLNPANCNGSSNYWECIDETTPNDATDYLSDTLGVPNGYPPFETNITDSTAAGVASTDPITLVQVGLRFASSSSTGGQTLSVRLRDGTGAGSNYIDNQKFYSGAIAWGTNDPTSGINIYPLTAYTRPEKTSPWTAAILDSTQIGTGHMNGATTQYVSAEWLLVEYNPPEILVSGTVYSNNANETTVFDCSGTNLTLHVSTNGGTNTDGFCTASNGTFLMAATAPATDNPLVLYVDSTETEKATSATLAADATSDITLNLIQDRLLLSHQSATVITNAKLSTGDNGNAGIRYAVSSSNLTVESGIELHVLAGKTFTPGGTVTTQGTGDLHVLGTATLDTATNAIAQNISVPAGGTLNINGSTTVTGNVTNATTGVINHTSGTPTLTVNGTGNFCGGTSGNCTVYNLIFGGASTTLASDVTVKNNLTLPATVTAGSTTVTMSGTSGTLVGGGTTLNNLTIDPSSAGTITLDTSDLTVSSTLAIANGDALSIAGSRTLTLSAASGASLNLNTTGTVSGAGTLTYKSSDDFPSAGTISSVLRMDATDGNLRLDCIAAASGGRTFGGQVEIYNNHASTARTVTLCDTASHRANFSSNLYLIAANGGNVTLEVNTFDPTVNVTGNLDYTGGGAGTETISMGGGTWTVSGDTNFTDGTINNSNGGTLIMNGSGKTLTIPSGSVYNLTISPPDGGTVNIGVSSNMTFDGALSVAANKTLNINNGGAMSGYVTSSVAGTGTITGNGTFSTSQTGTVSLPVATLDVKYINFVCAGGNQTIPARSYSQANGRVTFQTYGSTGRTQTLGAGTFDILGQMLVSTWSTTTGTITIDGTTYNPIVNISGKLYAANSGAVAETVNTGTGIWTIQDDVNLNYLTWNATSGNTVKMNGTSKTLTTAGNSLYNFEVASGSANNVTMSGATTVSNNLTITSGQLTAPSATTLTIGGNFTNSGTFTHNSGTVVIAPTTISTITGATTFNNFTSTTAGKTIKFQQATAGTPLFTFAGTFTITGSAGSLINLQSDTGGSQWLAHFNSAQPSSVTYANITDSGGDATSAAVTLNSTSTNGGNNNFDVWIFTSGGITISGRIYTDDGSSALDCTVARTVAVKVNGTGTVTANCSNTPANGSFSLTTVSVGSAGDVITVFISGATEKGTTVTRAADGSSNITGFDLYQDRLIVRDEDTTAISNANLGQYDKDNNGTNLFFTSNSNNLSLDSGKKLVVWTGTGKSYTPGGTVTTVAASTQNAPDGDVSIKPDATMTMGTNVLSIGGDYVNAGTFSKSTGQTTIFTATGTGFSITPNGNNFDNLTFNGSGGSWTMTAVTTVDVNLTITNGTLTAPSAANLSVAGNFTNNATFTHNSGTVILNGTAAQAVTTNAQSFNNLTLNNTGADGTTDDVTISGALDVNGTLDVTNGDLKLNTNDPNVTTAGNVSVGSSAFVTKADNGTATWIFDGSGTSTWTDGTAAGGQDLGLVSINGSSKTVNLASDAKATKLTIAGSQTFGLGSSGYTFTLTGSDWPYVNSGTLNEGTNSTVKFTGTADSYIEPETFWNLTIAPSNAGSPTYYIDPNETADPLNVSGNLTIGDETNVVALNVGAFSNLVVSGDVLIQASATLTNGSDSGAIFIGGSYTNNGTYNEMGNGLTFTATTSGKSLNGNLTGSSSPFLVFNGSGGEWTSDVAIETNFLTMTAGTLTGTGDITVSTFVQGTAGVINRTGGTFTVRPSSSQSFGPTTASTGWTFNNLTFGNSHASTGLTITKRSCATCGITVNGVLTIGKTGDAAATTLNAGDATWTLAGTGATPFALLGSPAATFTPATSTVTYTGVNGSGNVNVTTTTYFGLGCSPTATETCDVAGSLTVGQNLTVGSNGTLAIATGQTLTQTTGTLTLTGTISGAGTGTFEYKSATAFPATGTITAILRMNAINNAQSLDCSGGGGRTFGGAVEFYNGHASTARAITLCNGGSQTANFSSTVTLNGAGGGALTLEVNTNDPTVNITGNLTAATSGDGAETISLGSGTWTASGDVNLSDVRQLITEAGGTFVMNGTSKTLTTNTSQTSYFNNLTISPPGGATINVVGTGIWYNGVLSVAANTTLNINTGVYFKGNTASSVTGTGTITGDGAYYFYQTGIILLPLTTLDVKYIYFFDTEGNQTIPARSYGKSGGLFGIYSSGSSSYVHTLGAGTFNILADVYINAVAASPITIDGTTNPTVNISGFLAVDPGVGTETLNTGTGTWTVAGYINFTNLILNATSGNTFKMTGTNKTLTTAGNSLYNFEVASGSTNNVTMSGATTLVNNLIITSGTLTAPSAANLSVGGDFTNNSAFTHNSGTVTMTGSGKNITGSAGTTFNNLTISDSTTVAAGGNDQTVAGTLTVAAGKTLTIGTGRTVTASGSADISWGDASSTITGGTITFNNATSGGPGTGGVLNSTVRFDATNNDIPSGVVDARNSPAYGGPVVFYSNSSSSRTIHLGTGASQTLTFSSTFTGSTNSSGGLTISSATNSPTVNITGNVTFTKASTGVASLSMGAGTWTAAGNIDVTNSSCPTVNASNILTMTGASKSLVAQCTFATININGTDTITARSTASSLAIGSGATLTIAIDVTVTGATTLQSTSTINGNGALVVQGSLSDVGTISSNVTFDCQNIDVTAPARSYGGDVSFENNSAELNANSIILASGTIAISGTVDFNPYAIDGATVTVDGSANPTFNITGSLGTLMAFEGNVDVNMGNGTWTVGGNVYLNMTTLTSAGKIKMNGTGTLRTNGLTIHDLEISTAGTVTFANETHAMNGSLTLVANGTITVGTSVINMTGSGETIIGGGRTISGLTISNGTTLQTSDLTVSGTLTVANGKTLTLEGGRTLTNSGTANVVWGGATSTITGGTLRFTNTTSGGPGTSGVISSVVRYDTVSGNIPTGTVDARTYGGDVEFYSNIGSNRTITFGSGTFNITGNMKVITGSTQGSSTFGVTGASINPTINLTGNLTYTKGSSATPSITTGTGVWTVTGNVDLRNGTYTATSGNELLMNGTSNLYGNSQTLYKLTINGTNSTVTSSGGPKVSNILTIGGDAAANTDTLSISDSVDVQATATIVLTDSTDTIGGGGILYIRNPNTGNINTSGTVSVAYTWYTNNVSSMVLTARSYGGNVQVNNARPSGMTAVVSAGTLTIGGNLNLINSGEFNSGNLILNTSTNSPTVNLAGSFSVYDNTGEGFSNYYGASFGGTWTVNTNFDLSFIDTVTWGTGAGDKLVMDGNNATNTGTLTSNGRTLNHLTLEPANGKAVVLAAATHAVAGNLVLSGAGTLTTTGSTVNMTGSGKTIDGGGKTINGLTISDSTIVQTNNLTVAGTLTVAANKILTIDTVTLTDTGGEISPGTSSTIGGTGLLTFTDTSGGPSASANLTLSVPVRFDATANDITSTTVDARTYGGNVEFYNNSASNRTISMAGSTHTYSGNFNPNAASTGDVIVTGGTNSPTVNVTGNVDFTGTGTGTEYLVAGNGTWTVSGNVDLTGGFYAPQMLQLNPTWDRSPYYQYSEAPGPRMQGCVPNTSAYECESATATTLVTGYTAEIDMGCIASSTAWRAGMKYDLSSSALNNATIINAALAVNVVTTTSQSVYVHRSSSDTPDTASCTDGTMYDALASTGIYKYFAWDTSGKKYYHLGGTVTSDIQTRADSDGPISISVQGDGATLEQPTFNSVDNSLDQPMLSVGYVASLTSPTLVMNGTSKTLTPGGNGFLNLTLAGSITIANEEFMVAGNLDMTGGTVTPGSSYITMTGTAATLTASGTGSLSSLSINPSTAGTVTLAAGGGDLTVSGNLEVASGDTLSLGAGRVLTDSGGSDVNLTGTISGSGTLEFVNGSGGPGANGTLSAPVRFNATNGDIASNTVDPRTYGGAVTFYNNHASASRTITPYVSYANDTFIYSSTVTTSSPGGGTLTVDMNINYPSITVIGNMTIGANTTFSANNTGTLAFKGNYTNSGTFTHNSGTVELNGTAQQTLSGTLSGTTGKFNNLTITNVSGSDPEASPSVIFSNNVETAGTFTAATANTKLRFNAGITATLQNISFNGQTGTFVYLRSSATDSAWNLNVAGTRSISNTDVRDSNACGQAPDIDATDGTNIDRTGNSCWWINTISFAISDTTIGFGSCQSGAARYATGDAAGSANDSADAHTMTLSTSARVGYSLTAFGPTLTSNADTISAIGGTAAASNPGTEQFGMRVIKNSGAGQVSSPYDTSDWAYDAASAPDQIASHNGSASTSVYGVRYICNINGTTTEPGNYSTDLTYVLTGTF